MGAGLRRLLASKSSTEEADEAPVATERWLGTAVAHLAAVVSEADACEGVRDAIEEVHVVGHVGVVGVEGLAAGEGDVRRPSPLMATRETVSQLPSTSVSVVGPT